MFRPYQTCKIHKGKDWEQTRTCAAKISTTHHFVYLLIIYRRRIAVQPKICVPVLKTLRLKDSKTIWLLRKICIHNDDKSNEHQEILIENTKASVIEPSQTTTFLHDPVIEAFQTTTFLHDPVIEASQTTTILHDPVCYNEYDESDSSEEFNDQPESIVSNDEFYQYYDNNVVHEVLYDILNDLDYNMVYVNDKISLSSISDQVELEDGAPNKRFHLTESFVTEEPASSPSVNDFEEILPKISDYCTICNFENLGMSENKQMIEFPFVPPHLLDTISPLITESNIGDDILIIKEDIISIESSLIAESIDNSSASESYSTIANVKEEDLNLMENNIVPTTCIEQEATISVLDSSVTEMFSCVSIYYEEVWSNIELLNCTNPLCEIVDVLDLSAEDLDLNKENICHKRDNHTCTDSLDAQPPQPKLDIAVQTTKLSKVFNRMRKTKPSFNFIWKTPQPEILSRTLFVTITCFNETLIKEPQLEAAYSAATLISIIDELLLICEDIICNVGIMMAKQDNSSRCTCNQIYSSSDNVTFEVAFINIISKLTYLIASNFELIGKFSFDIKQMFSAFFNKSALTLFESYDNVDRTSSLPILHNFILTSLFHNEPSQMSYFIHKRFKKLLKYDYFKNPSDY